MSYLMESPEETARLLAQQAAEDARTRLLAVGLAPGARALDVGCGPGLITRVMGDLVGPLGVAVGLDRSGERLVAARAVAADCPNVSFVDGDVRALPFEDGEFDLVHSQYLFQYLRDPVQALAELRRVTRPGGTVVVSEIDGSGLTAWPCPAEVVRGLDLLCPALAEQGFDFYIGRKMYHLFRKMGLVDVQVRLYPHYVLSGAADERTLEDWRVRFSTLSQVGARAFGTAALYEEFCTRYLALLADEEALKYAVLLVTGGRRP